MDELKQPLERVRMACGQEDYKLMKAVVETLSYLFMANSAYAAIGV